MFFSKTLAHIFQQPISIFFPTEKEHFYILRQPSTQATRFGQGTCEKKLLSIRKIQGIFPKLILCTIRTFRLQ
jgi:hypothetical protein